MSKQFNPAFDMPETVEQAVAVIASWGSPSVMTFSSQRAKRCADMLQNQTPIGWIQTVGARFVGKEKRDAQNGYTMPVYASPFGAPAIEPGACDPEVYSKGASVCLVDVPKETAEHICRNISAATGWAVDWHYIGGRVHIKALHKDRTND